MGTDEQSVYIQYALCYFLSLTSDSIAFAYRLLYLSYIQDINVVMGIYSVGT